MRSVSKNATDSTGSPMAAKPWTLYPKQEKQLYTLHLKNLRRILCITWQNEVDHQPGCYIQKPSSFQEDLKDYISYC